MTCTKSKDQLGKVSNPTHGQLDRETKPSISPFPFAPENLVLLGGDPGSNRSLSVVLTHGIPPDFRDGVHSFI